MQCDPSHPRSPNDMSRTSTSTSTTTTKTSCSSHPRPSPTAGPPPTQEVSPASQESMSSFGSNAIDDFVLFPEDTPSWNPADLALPEFDSQDYGLIDANFDINDIDLNGFSTMNMGADQSLDVSFEQPWGFQLDRQFSYTPFVPDQYGLDPWAEPQGYMPLSHSRPHAAQGSGQLDSSWHSSGLPGVNSPGHPQTGALTGEPWPDFSMAHSQLSESSAASAGSGVDISPVISSSSSSFSSLDWGVFDSSASQSPQVENSSPESSQPTNRKARRSHKRRQNDAVQELLDLVPSHDADQSRLVVDSSNQRHPQPSHPQPSHPQPSPLGHADDLSQLSPRLSDNFSDNLIIGKTYAVVVQSLQAFKSASAEHHPLSGELEGLRDTLDTLVSSHGDGFSSGLPDSVVSLLQTLTFQLQVSVSRVKNAVPPRRPVHQHYSRLDRQCQVNTMRIIQSLRAAVVGLQAQNSEPSTENVRVLTSGYNKHLAVSLFESHNSGARPQSTPVQLLADSSVGGISRTQLVATLHGGILADLPNETRPGGQTQQVLPGLNNQLLSNPGNFHRGESKSAQTTSVSPAHAAVTQQHDRSSPANLSLENTFDQSSLSSTHAVVAQNTVDSSQDAAPAQTSVSSWRGATPRTIRVHGSEVDFVDSVHVALQVTGDISVLQYCMLVFALIASLYMFKVWQATLARRNFHFLP
jgi:hypothetical protein